MSIELKQFDGSTITPKDDAIMYEILTGVSGIISGCDLTAMGGGVIKIGSGRGIIKGRQFVVQEESISVELSASGEKKGRVYIHMDLSNEVEPIQILYVTADELPDLVQDEDCNETNGIYDMELAIYNASTLAISNLEKTVLTMGKSWENFAIKNKTDLSAVQEYGYLADAVVVKQIMQDAGVWIGPYTIPSGSTSYVISDASITATSIIDVYPSNDTADIMAAASPSVSQSVQTAGSLTIVFETATTAAITIEAVKVVNL